MVFAEMQRKSGFIWRRPWKSRTVIAAGENVAGLLRGCDGQEREFGPDHCDVATTLSNLCNAYDRLGNIQKQKELLERALDINEREYGVALRALVNSNIRMCYDVFAFSHGNSN
jgi:tetratricopeptide (TPR) repeat protein